MYLAVYGKIGENSLFSIEPKVLHFAGYRLNVRNTKAVKIVNKSSTMQRFHLIQPVSKDFQVRMEKKGAIPPGMSEIVLVDFFPRKHAYFGDELKIHSADNQNQLFVPIHAYPVLTQDSTIPNSVDFGGCGVGQVMRKKYRLKSAAPVDFEFKFELQNDNSNGAFSVEPAEGVITDKGTAITLTFEPRAYSSQSCTFIFRVSQFEKAPQYITCLGSGAPGLVRKTVLSQLSLTQSYASGMDEVDAIARTRKLGGGSGGGYLVTRYKSQLAQTALLESIQSGKAPTLTLKRPTQRPKTPPTLINGIRVPSRMDNISAVRSVLISVPGKIPVPELKKALLLQREQTQSQGAGAELDRMEGMDPNVRDYVFFAAMKQFEQNEKDKEIKWSRAVGSPAQSQSSLQRMSAMQESLVQEELAEQRKENLYPEEGRRRGPNPSMDDDALPIALYPAVSVDPWQHAPSFNFGVSDAWEAQTRALTRFRTAASIVVARYRAGCRLASIQTMITQAGGTKQAVRALVEASSGSSKSAGAGGDVGLLSKQNSSMSPSHAVSSKSMHPMASMMSMPTLLAEGAHPASEIVAMRAHVPAEYRDEAFDDASTAGEGVTFDPGEVAVPLELKITPEYRLRGYPPCQLSEAGSNVPLENDRILRSGAEEERFRPSERGEEPTPASTTVVVGKSWRIGAGLRNPYLPLQPLLHPRVFVRSICHSESQLDYRVRPIRRNVPLVQDRFGQGTMAALQSTTTLSHVYCVRREAPSWDWNEALPRLMTSAEEEDNMSDVDSMSEYGDLAILPPPPAASDVYSQFYVPGKTEEQSENKEQEGQDKDKPNDDNETKEGEGELSSKERVDYSPRDLAWNELAESRAAEWKIRSQKSTDSLNSFNDVLKDPLYRVNV